MKHFSIVSNGCKQSRARLEQPRQLLPKGTFGCSFWRFYRPLLQLYSPKVTKWAEKKRSRHKTQILVNKLSVTLETLRLGTSFCNQILDLIMIQIRTSGANLNWDAKGTYCLHLKKTLKESTEATGGHKCPAPQLFKDEVVLAHLTAQRFKLSWPFKRSFPLLPPLTSELIWSSSWGIIHYSSRV